VNPHFHDEFVTLVPLFYSGELTDEEWALLQVHMAYCDSCREAFEQYRHVASDVIPVMAASAAAESAFGPRESETSLRAAEQQLMNRLQGRPVSDPVSTSKSPWAWMAAGAIAACAAGGLVYAGIRHLDPPSHQQVVSSSRVNAGEPVAPLSTGTEPTEHDAVVRDEQKLSSLENQLAESEKRSAEAKAAIAGEKRLLETEETQQQQLLTQRDALSQQLAAAQADAQSLREKLTAAQSGAGDEGVRVTALEGRVHHLDAALDEANASLDAKEKMLAFDRDLMLHDRDIRDVIGARNLYIADIYDTNASGATAKPFGRIFYTKDSSLVFYGFDLDKQAGMKQPVAFQAWGSGTDNRPVSLGLFYQDDGHKHWVLRSKDAATLARLNMVFVTVEPPGGSNKPTGKQFLRAYLQIQPNHP
jgi:anti-sigma-K factor RskA